MKVLISAYACAPGQGSEPGMGWGWVRRVAQEHDVWVVTAEAHRRDLERAQHETPTPRVRFHFVDLPPLLLRLISTLGGRRLRYYLWQIAAWRLARKLHHNVGFDCGQHCSYGIYWMPSFLALMPFPYIWGPVGGAEAMPFSFWRELPMRGKAFEAMRLAAQRLGEFDPWVRATASRAALTLAATPDTEARVRRIGCRRVRVCSQFYITADEIRALAQTPMRRERPFRIITTATLIHWKGYDLALRAFARLATRHPESEYWILGDGPDRARFERLSVRLGIATQVSFLGLVKRHVWMRLLAESDVLLFPSLHDSGGFVCPEAMAAGRPVVCLKLGGPAITVDCDSGVRVAAKSPRQAVADLGEALIRLAKHPDERIRLAKGARHRVQTTFNFDERSDWISELYARAREQPGCGQSAAASATAERAG